MSFCSLLARSCALMRADLPWAKVIHARELPLREKPYKIFSANFLRSLAAGKSATVYGVSVGAVENTSSSYGSELFGDAPDGTLRKTSRKHTVRVSSPSQPQIPKDRQSH